MNPRTDTEPTTGDIVTELASLFAGLGMMTMVLFPFAVPALAFAAIVVVPLLALALVVGVVSAVLAAPVLAVRALVRHERPARRSGYRRVPVTSR
jgi:hypothetical protein